MAREKLFKGNNALSAREIFNARVKYSRSAYPTSANRDYPGLLRDFWFIENLYYGRIDRSHRAIVAPRNKLKSLIPTERKSVLILDFVADAFADMKKEFDKHLNLGRIRDDDPHLSDISAEKSWIDLNVLYNNHSSPFRKEFINRYILARSIENEIESFEDFVDLFMSFLEENLSGVPFTRTGFLTSKYCSPLVSGLHIEIADLDYANDERKISEIIDSPNFNFFELCATKYGFLIDKNVPWRIVANVGSVEMENYMKKYDTDSNDLFKDYYKFSIDKDVDIFAKYCVKAYNTFVNSRPNIKKVSGQGKDKKVFFKRRNRARYVDHAPTTAEKQKYWVDKYIKLRNVECHSRYSKAFMANISLNVSRFLDKGDYGAALKYIERCFIGFLNDSGAYNTYTYVKTATEEGMKVTRQELEDVLLGSIPLSRETQY